ncbi:MAG: formylmethanofuran dehydrogenase subunit E family protein [Desulfobacteraceae bacterium]|jgi:formylmethanofuran dehydrogenase subunit E
MSSEEKKFGPYTSEEYFAEIEKFHGHMAPGLIVGGFMVEMARKHIAKGVLFDAICETSQCLPDAIQMLTPCTVGNRWLKIFDLGRFALALFDKYTGYGVRVFVDPEKLEPFAEIKAWFFRTDPKKAQDSERLLAQVKETGEKILTSQRVRVKPQALGKQHKGRIGMCPLCGEAHPLKDGSACLGCQGQAPYA